MGVGKATINRPWTSKAVAFDLLMQLAAPLIAVDDTADPRTER